MSDMEDELLGDLNSYQLGSVRNVLIDRLKMILTQCQPYPGDGMPIDPTYRGNEPWFIVKTQDFEMYSIYDQVQGFDTHIHITHLHWSTFSVGKWFAEVCARQNSFPYSWEHAHQWLASWTWGETTMGEVLKQQAEVMLHLGAPYANEVDNMLSTKNQFKVTYNIAAIEWF